MRLRRSQALQTGSPRASNGTRSSTNPPAGLERDTHAAGFHVSCEAATISGVDVAGLDAEELTLRRFVIADRRDRLASVVRTKKRYSEIMASLSHGNPWDDRWRRELPVRDHHTAAVERILRAHGAPEICHVLGGSGDVDGKQLPLHDALAQVVGSRIGALVICIPGQLAYHEGEELHDRNVLYRPPA